MASLYIRTLTVTDGSKRYAVKYRRGGVGFPVEHAGTFKTQREALIRKRVVGEWLAAGANPRVELRRSLAPPLTMEVACREWLVSRRSVTETTRANYATRIRHITEHLKVAPTELTVGDVNAWVTVLEETYAPGTVALFVATLRQVLDHAGVTPNVARDRRVELPRRERRAVVPPTSGEFLSVLQRTNARYRPIVVLLEQTGMRVSEAVDLEWADVDVGRGRLLVTAARSKTNRARWVEVADWVVEALGEEGGRPLRKVTESNRVGTMPLPTPLRQPRVFPGVTRQKVYNAITAACQQAGIPAFGPHALRHRRASILHMRGVPAAQAAAMLGHSPQLHLSTYAHVIGVEEVAVQDVLSCLGSTVSRRNPESSGEPTTPPLRTS